MSTAEVYEQLGHLEDYGLSVTGRAYDFDKMVQRKQKFAVVVDGSKAKLHCDLECSSCCMSPAPHASTLLQSSYLHESLISLPFLRIISIQRLSR